ncbi:MAG: hypothetical protein HY821_18795 [Acidobacteria bacterium]|nr:hypothetical protein [Acidobacteriota bacterium]
MRFTAGIFLFAASASFAANLDLSRASIVVRPGARPAPEQTAAKMLAEEVEKRTGLRLPVVTGFPVAGPAIVITGSANVPGWPRQPQPVHAGAEGYRLDIQSGDKPVVWIAANDARGALFGAGYLLRQLQWGQGKLALSDAAGIETAPRSPLRGHQLGYRTTANSWDAWSIPQFEQYIRDLAVFGSNAVENIPSQDNRPNPLMKIPRPEMNRAMSEICQRYGQEYWVWTPVTHDLNEKDKNAKQLAEFEEFFKGTPFLTGVFVPGGDPGDNPPELVLPFLAQVAEKMKAYHPNAKIWLSLQGFNEKKAEVVYQWIDKGVPAWFGGLVNGPSSPDIPKEYARVAGRVPIRLYPDVTHNKISQYEVPEWDQAYALTLGREAVNPRPFEYAAIHNRYAAMSNGFLSYSDGVHDDVNKVLWSSLAWDPQRPVRDVVIEYCRYFFSSENAEEAADLILALERNWNGSLVANGSVESTLRHWNDLEKRSPQLAGNWRWQMCLLRANYDAYVRRRLIQDTELEEKANTILAQVQKLGSEKAISAATATLNEAVDDPAGPELRARIIELCARLYQSIWLQTSVAKYNASGAERGAVLDFIDNPLNNRWWLEDEFAKVRKVPDEAAKAKRLLELARWEHPGEGSFYDNVGNLRKAPHVGHCEGEDCTPLFWWWDNGKSRARLSWQVTLWPKEMVYEGLDPKAAYVVRTTGYGQPLLRVDGEKIKPTVDGKEMADYKEFPVPASALQDGKLVLTWDKATGEENLNWRRHSRLAEVWLLKR